MDQRTVLVPVQYPLAAPSERTVRQAAEFAGELGDTHLYLLHVNMIHEGERVTWRELQRAVEGRLGRLDDASYHVRDAFLLEEAVLDEAVHQDADYIVIGRSRRARLRQWLETRIGAAVDLEAYLRRHLNAKLVVV